MRQSAHPAAPGRRHFLLGSAAACAALLTGARAGAQGAPPPLTPAQRVARLTAMTQQAEALRAVRRVQNAFAHHVTFGRWSDAAALFAPDAMMRGRTRTALGQDDILTALRETLGGGQDGPAPGAMTTTFAMSPVVNVSAEGTRAQGRWRELSMLLAPGGGGHWAGGIYENEYVLRDGVWKIGFLNYYGRFEGPYDGGWRNTANGGEIAPFHYDARTAGTPAAPLPAGLPPTPDADHPAAIAAAAARLRALIDEAQVRNLQNAYGYYVDRRMWDDVADLFAPDGALHAADAPAAQGRAAIRAALEALAPAGLRTGDLNDHAQIQTVVTLSPDGLAAQAQGMELAMTGVNMQAGQWSVALFHNDYVKRDGVWTIAAMRITPLMTADYAQGWNAASLTGAAPAPALGAPGGPLAHAPAAPATLEEAERLLAVALAYDGTENICNAYGYWIDEFQWDDTGELFSADGWKELSYVGAYIGRDRVRDSMKFRYGLGGRGSPSMTLHQKIQPVISVSEDGQSARLRTRLLQMNSSPAAPGSYIGGIYEDECELENGVWKIAGMDLDYVWLGDYASGWTRVEAAGNARFSPGAAFLEQMPPDRPLRGVTYAPFPEIAPMGFHYANPVSGREPAVLLPPGPAEPA